jgi:hypothetical protein
VHRRMIQHVFGAAAPALGQPVQDLVERFSIERVVQKKHDVAGRIPITARVGANQPHVRTTAVDLARFSEIVGRDRVQARREFDANDLRERIFGRQQDCAAHSGPRIDKRGSPYRFERHGLHQTAESIDRHGFVVRSVRAGIADGLGIEVA